MIEIQGILIDLSAIRSIAHRCDPAKCRASRACCACYEVAVTERELSAIIGMLPDAARFAPHLCEGWHGSARSRAVCGSGRSHAGRPGHGYDRIPRQPGLRSEPWHPGGFVDVFEEADDGKVVLATDDDMRCVFAFAGRAGETLCSLHAAALAAGLDPAAHKPESCWLWPLALSDDRPHALTVMSGAYAFPCNRRRRGIPKGLHAGIREIIAGAFGERFVQELEERF